MSEEVQGYDRWKLASPPEDEGLEKYLEEMSFEEVFEVCGEKIMRDLYRDWDWRISEAMTKYYYDNRPTP